MRITFKPLWKLLIDRDMTREDLRRATGLPPATIATLNKVRNGNAHEPARIRESLERNLANISPMYDEPKANRNA